MQALPGPTLGAERLLKQPRLDGGAMAADMRDFVRSTLLGNCQPVEHAIKILRLKGNRDPALAATRFETRSLRRVCPAAWLDKDTNHGVTPRIQRS